jgi:nitrogen fixation NifU-like protein
MDYSERVLDHFARPRNVGAFAPGDEDVGTGRAGAPGGDVMKLQIKVGVDGVIAETRFRTQGSPAAIACASLASEWLKGRSLDAAAAIGPTDLAEALALPPERIHCSILASDAVQAAVADYLCRHAKGGSAKPMETWLHD